MARSYKAGIIITGDAKGGVTAIQATQAEVKKLGATTKRVGKETTSAFDSLKTSIFSMQTAITAVVGVAGLGAIITKTIQAGDEIQKMSTRIGASTEALSQYRHVAEKTGVTFDQLTMGWQRQTRRIAEAAKGTGEAKKALEELGLSAQALAKLAPEKQFEILADAITGVAEESDKVRLAQKLWDSEGVKLLQTIKGGSVALREMRQDAHELGLTITQETADSMAEFKDQLTEMSAAAEGFAMSITSWILPSLTELVRHLDIAAKQLEQFLDRIGLIESRSSKIKFANLRNEAIALTKEIQKVEAAMNAGTGMGSLIMGARAGGRVDTSGMDALRQKWVELQSGLLDIKDAMRDLEEITSDELPSSLGKTETAVTKISKSFKKASKETDTFGKELQSLIDRLDPIAAKTRKYMEEVELLNRAWVEGRISGEQYDSLIFSLASGIEKTAQQSTKTVVELTEKSDPYAEAWINSFKRVDDAFADLWRGAFDSFEDFGDALNNAFMQLLAELAHAAITQPILIQLGMGGTGGTAGLLGGLFGGGGASGGGGLLGPIGSIGNLISGLFGGGSIASGAAGGASLLGAGGASLGGNFIAGGTGIATAGGLGGLGAISSMLPYVGAGYALFNLISGFMEEAPSPRFGVGGDIGSVRVNWSRDIEEAGASQAVDIMVDAINQYEQRLLATLDEAQMSALSDYTPLDVSMIAPDSEHEMGMALATRISGILEQFDGALADQWDRAVMETMWSPDQIEQSGIGAFSLGELYSDYQRGIVHEVGGQTIELIASDLDELYNQILLPALGDPQEEAQALADEMARLAKITEDYHNMLTDLNEQYDRLTMSDIALELRDINDWMKQATEAADDFGASLEVYTKIQEVARLRTEAAIKSATDSIRELAEELYGSGDSVTASLESRIQIEQERIANQQSAALELYNTEMARYRDAETAINSIGDFLSSIQTGSLSPFTPQQQLTSARSDYASTLALAMSGDPAALADIASRSSTLLQQSQSFNASSADYKSDFSTVNKDLLALAQRLGLITEPTAPGDISTSSLLQMLEQQRLDIEAQDELENRRALAEELAKKIGDLGLALDESVFDLMEQNGIDLAQLAKDLGLATSQVDRELIDGLSDMSQMLHVDLIDLARKLGIDLDNLARAIMDAMGSYTQAFRDSQDWFSSTTAGDVSQVGNLTYTRGPGDTATITSPSGTYDITSGTSIFELANQIPELNASLTTNYGDDYLSDTFLTAYAKAVTDYQGWFASTSAGDTASVDGMTYLRGSGDSATIRAASGAWPIFLNSNLRDLANQIPELAASLLKNYGVNFAFASGIGYVPADMVAQIHAGEMIIDRGSADAMRAASRYGIQPAANDALISEVKALRAEVIELRADMTTQHSQTMVQRSSQIQATEGATNEQRRLVSRSLESGRAAKRA